ncbi:hypothetical protein ACHQM5_007861 [Ranunculus cassubicifolius]
MSASFRVFRGCKTLMAAAAKGSSSKSSGLAAPVSVASTKKKKPSSSSSATSDPKPPGTSAFSRPLPVSPALHQFLGVPEASRSLAVKMIWDYIKANNLKSPEDKKIIQCDEKLKTIFQGKDKVGFTEIAKLLSPHFLKTAAKE